MRKLIALFVSVTVAGLLTMAAQDKKPPEKIVIPSKQGATPFLHSKHIERENGDCTACHDKLWPQSRAQKASSTGCYTCHKTEGRAFSAQDKNNCVRCHPTGSEKSS
jgi:hypothetical protein